MTKQDTVRLLDVEPDLGRYLTADDADALDGLPVPIVGVGQGELDLHTLLVSRRAFGAVILDGLLVRTVVAGEARMLRLLGPGDVLGSASAPESTVVDEHGWRAGAPTTLAMLDRDILLAAHRVPRLVAGLYARAAEQTDRVAVQAAICQMPRVEDRVLAVLWLLAESWGQVTAHGTALRLHLTHESIGSLVGARRSTVTLALGQLTDEGSILRQDQGWLLLEAPPHVEHAPVSDIGPELLGALPAHDDAPLAAEPLDKRLAELREIGDDLASVRELNRRRIDHELARLRQSRRVSRELREESRAKRRSRAGLHHDDHASDGLGPSEREADDAAAERLAAPVDSVDD
jgi:CRP-like cAMP-binding protein